MLTSRVFVWLLPCLAFTTTIFAQSSSTSALSFPVCATECIVNAFTDRLCDSDDQKCICTSEMFKSSVSACVAGGCSIPDALATKNASLANCGVPMRDRSGSYVTISNVLVSITGVIIAIRFAYKIFIAKLIPGMDDWFVLATLAAATPSAIITVNGTTAHGLGKDIWTLTPDQITRVLRNFYVMACLYYTQVALAKLSIITFYMRIFPQRDVKRILWGTFIFTVCWGIAFVTACIFQCRPVSHFWNKWDGLHDGKCVSDTGITWSNAVISITLDLWMLAVPLWQLRGLHLHWKKKVGVALMFCIGTFVTIVSILRLQSLVHLASSANVTWNFFDVSVWSTVEICVAMICASLPTIRLALVRFFPILGGSSHRSRGNQYYEYGTGANTHATGTRGRGTVGTATAERREPSSPVSGIVFEKTYDVQFSDDEAKLVQMNELDSKGRAVHPSP